MFYGDQCGGIFAFGVARDLPERLTVALSADDLLGDACRAANLVDGRNMAFAGVYGTREPVFRRMPRIRVLSGVMRRRPRERAVCRTVFGAFASRRP
jgi:hypothetical protein